MPRHHSSRKPFRHTSPTAPSPSAPVSANATYIYGKHALVEALRNTPHVIDEVFLSSEAQEDVELHKLVKLAKVTSSSLGGGKNAPRIDAEVSHQGVVARISVGKLMRPYKEFVEGLEITPNTALVILGELQDLQNVGAVIRSAAAFGIAGILVPEHNQAPITGTVVKVSAGMAFRVPLVTIGNVNNAVRDLKERGFWIYGLDGEAKKVLHKQEFDTPTAFILGNESTGIREKTRELCDTLLSIQMSPECESLNAAASAAVALYAWSIQHQEALRATPKAKK